MGLTAVTLLLTSTLIVRNTRIVDAFETRAAQPASRNRQRRRQTLENLLNTG
jgi:hypothetical protein